MRRAKRRVDASSLLGRFLGDRTGGVAMMFGLALVPISVLLGAGLDYSRASDAKAALAAAADAAALATVAPSILAWDAGKAQTMALDVFKARTAALTYASGISATIDVEDTKNGRTTSVTFSANVPTSLLKLAGLSTVPVNGDAKAASVPPLYIDFYLLLDNTPSMGLGATTADITKLQSLTVHQPDGSCAFACHVTSGGGTDNYTIARNNGVTMRIDVVRQATQQLMDTATATATVASQFRAAVYTFGTSCGTAGPQTISRITSDLAGVKSSASAIDLMSTPYQNYNSDQCTDFDGTLSAMNQIIPAPGDGLTGVNAQKVMFFVSDGVADAHYPASCSRPTTGGRCQEPITVADCNSLKARGVKVAVLYTTYLPLPTNSWYNQWIAPFAGTIPTQMSSCASPGLYFEVSPSQGISDAMKALFQKTVSMARLSQ